MGEVLKGRIEAMVSEFNVHDEKWKQEVLDSLVKIGKPAVPYLIEALKERSAFVEKGAAKAIGRIGVSEEQLERIIQMCKSGEWTERRGAAMALGQIAKHHGNSRMDPVLMEMLKDEDVSVREEAAEALGENRCYSASLDLIGILKNDEEAPFVRNAASGALKKIRPKHAVDALIELTEKGDHLAQSKCIEILGEIKDAKAVPGLINEIKNESSAIREQTAQALGKIGVNDEQFGTIMGMLEKGDALERAGAASALGCLKSKKAVPALIRSLEDENNGVRVDSASALGDIGDPQAVPSLIRTLGSQKGILQQKAAQALGKIGVNNEQFETILRMLESGGEQEREGAVQALNEIKDLRAVPALIERLMDEDGMVQLLSAKAIGKIGVDEDQFETILEMLSEEGGAVKCGAIRALGSIGDQRAMPALLEALDDDELEVRGFAAQELYSIAKEGDLSPDEIMLCRLLDLALSADDPHPKTRIRDEEVPFLIRALEDKHDPVRASAINLLAMSANPKAVRPLIEILESDEKDKSVRWCAVAALGRLRFASAVPILIKTLDDEDSDIANGAAEALEAISEVSWEEGDLEKIIPKLREIMGSGNGWARIDAARTLAVLGDDEAVSVLMDMMKKEENYARQAAEALEDIIRSCSSSEDVSSIENMLLETYEELFGGRESGSNDERYRFVKLRMISSGRKNELAEDKGVLLDDKPKPPKKGKMYNSARKKRNA